MLETAFQKATPRFNRDFPTTSVSNTFSELRLNSMDEDLLGETLKTIREKFRQNIVFQNAILQKDIQFFIS